MFIRRIFEAPVGSGGGGTGGTGSNEPGAGETPPALTHESVHGAISDRFKRFEGKLDERFKSYDGKLAKLDMLDQILEKLGAATPAPAAEEPKGKGKTESDEGRAAKAESEKMRKRLDAIEAERAAERAKFAETEERSALQAALVESGITDARLQRLAMTELYTEQKRVRRDAEGRIVFRAADKYGEEVDFEIKEGIKTWAGTDDAKAFIPARDVRGSGAKPSTQRAGNTKAAPSRADKIAEANTTLFEAVKGVFGGG